MASQSACSSEVLLYRVLQRANLLQYYDIFISQGGDDVPQLCEAGEEEFLEIMALVGMASKPLHVRRLQKALQEWVTNPDVYHVSSGPYMPPASVATGSILAAVQQTGSSSSSLLAVAQRAVGTSSIRGGIRQSTPVSVSELAFQPYSTSDVVTSTPGLSSASNMAAIIPRVSSRWTPPPPGSPRQSPSPPPMMTMPTPIEVSPMAGQHHLDNSSMTSPDGISFHNGHNGSFSGSYSARSPCSTGTNGAMERSSSPLPMCLTSSSGGLDDSELGSLSLAPACSTTQALNEEQIDAIAAAAGKLADTLPKYEQKSLKLKKAINKEILNVMNMAADDPDYMDKLRIYAAIYGRHDSNRKTDKMFNMHEVCVNEAAAQLCKHRPALLSRREDLFPLARQVVRDSGYQYTKGHSRAQSSEGGQSCKKIRVEPPPRVKLKTTKEVRLDEITDDLCRLNNQMEGLRVELQQNADSPVLVQSLQQQLMELVARQQILLGEQNELMRKRGRGRPRKYPHREKETAYMRKKLQRIAAEAAAAAAAGGGGGGMMDKDSLSYSAASFPVSMVTRGSMRVSSPSKGSLYEAGCQLAEQYGMEDFAAELQDMQGVVRRRSRHGQRDSRGESMRRVYEEDDGEEEEAEDAELDDEVDEQEQWSRQVEEDRIKYEQVYVPASSSNSDTPVAGSGSKTEEYVKYEAVYNVAASSKSEASERPREPKTEDEREQAYVPAASSSSGDAIEGREAINSTDLES